ncbi:putative transcription factor MYB/SANT family [Dioscorea sansibarensis]
MSKSCLLISYSSEIINGEPILVSSNCFPVKALFFEPAGHAFHDAALKLLGFYEEEDADADTDDLSVKSDDRGQAYRASSDSYSSKGKKKSSSGSKQQDHYALLGLAHLRFLATEEQIRKCYRETALKHHPDKQAALLLAEESEEAKEAKKAEIESHFKAIQEAYEVLIDPVKRRIYDSTDEFDDEVPADCAPQDFFKVFGPAFMRNGRWSVAQPVPSLGEENSSMQEVDSFYDFWYTFKSWREFPHADEFDLEQAESRDHKRWMERQNAKLREKAKKEEYARIRSLVDNAYRKDPRIIRRKEEEKAEKQRKKEAKYLARKLQEEEAAKAAEEERRRKEEDEKRAAEAALNQKKLKEKEKRLMRKERTRLRSLSAPVLSQPPLNLTNDDVERLCGTFDMDQLRHLCDNMEREEGIIEKAHLLADALHGEKTKAEKDARLNSSQNSDQKANGATGQANRTNNPLSNYEKKEKPWAKDEIEMLRKGMQKYPKGTSRRWEVISEYIGTGRSVEEILKATKTVLLQKPDSSRAFDSFLEKRKPAQSITSPLTSRTESEGLPAVQVKNIASNTIPTQTSSSNGTGNNPESEPVSVPTGVSSEQDTWSATQERALVQALKTFPKETSQRWERVAAAIPGKTVNQCKKKFALMKENFRSKKNAE